MKSQIQIEFAQYNYRKKVIHWNKIQNKTYLIKVNRFRHESASDPKIRKSKPYKSRIKTEKKKENKITKREDLEESNLTKNVNGKKKKRRASTTPF